MLLEGFPEVVAHTPVFYFPPLPAFVPPSSRGVLTPTGPFAFPGLCQIQRMKKPL